MTPTGTLVRHYTARELLESAERAIRERRHGYANRVLTHRMSQREADSHIARMEAIAAWLRQEADRERLL